MVSVHSTTSVDPTNERDFLDIKSVRRPVFSVSPTSVATAPSTRGVSTPPVSEQPTSSTPPDSEQLGSIPPSDPEQPEIQTPVDPYQPENSRRSTRKRPSVNYSVATSFSDLLGDSAWSKARESGVAGGRRKRSHASTASQSRKSRKSDCASTGVNFSHWGLPTTNGESFSKSDDTSPCALLNSSRSQRTGRILAPDISPVPASHFPPDPGEVDTASSSLAPNRSIQKSQGTGQSVRREVQYLLSQIDSPGDTETDDTSADASLAPTDDASRIIRTIVLRLAPEKLKKFRDG